MPQAQHFDIIISGSGPAGAATALALRNGGFRVAVLDKATFPRDKVCGDAIPGGAIKALKALSETYHDEFLSFSKKVTISGVRLVSPNMHSLDVHFSRTGYVSMRTDFDDWLRNIAVRDSGATFFEGVQVTSVKQLEGGIQVHTKSGQVFSAQIAIAADGTNSVFKSGLTSYKMDPRHFCGAVRAYYGDVKSVRENMLEVYFLKGYLPGYFWIFPLPGNRANVGFGMLTQTISERKLDLKKCLENIVADFPEVAERFKGSKREGLIQGFGLPLGSKKIVLSGERFMLTGDAGSLIDPFSGEGIGNAMQSGIIAATFAEKAIKARNFSAEFLCEYDKAVYEKLGGNLLTSYRMQRILSDRAWLVNGLVGVAGRSRFVRNWLHKIM